MCCQYNGFKLDVISDEKGIRVYHPWMMGQVAPIATFTGNDALLVKKILFGEIQFYNVSEENEKVKLEVIHPYEEKSEKPESFDPISHPSHYAEGREYEPRKAIEDWGLDWYLGNVIKYIARAGRKGDILEDLKKARQCLDWEIEKWTKS